MGRPIAPIDFAHAPTEPRGHVASRRVELTADDLAALAATGVTIETSAAELMEASRDWWPLAMQWAAEQEVFTCASVVVRPADAAQVAAVVGMANERALPVTAAGGRSGVCGASVPAHGGIVLDTTAMQGIVAIDDASLTLEVLPGTFGDELEAELAIRGYTLGHWPQSISLSTVGGWLACRSAGQYSTRYGKIEDMVVALEVVLADGSIVHTGGMPRAAVGPDLTQLFVGSEGTLGVITRAWLRLHPAPPAERRAAYSFASFEAGVDACRRILRRGATPAVLRLYDEPESKRSQGTDSGANLLVLDEGDPAIVDAVMGIVAQECAAAAPLDVELVERWMHHRNDVSALAALTGKGFVVDTMEVSAPWSAVNAVFDAARAALMAVPTTRSATCHLSHSYGDGACLYFTFAATPESDRREATYVALWDAGSRAILAAGGNLSHHHGVGLNRNRFVAEALGRSLGVLDTVKRALDPNGILNPGKLGLASSFADAPAWP